MEITPIGIFHCSERYAYDVPRQGALSLSNQGQVELFSGKNFEQSLQGLDSFSHIWLVFGFHQNSHWKPMVQPPRHLNHKIGVFASRAPYRPNALGLSCVELAGVRGLTVFVRNHDLLDGTPIFDIKPYLPYADSFPEASSGWTAEPGAVFYRIEFSSLAAEQLEFLENRQVTGLRSFIRIHLENEPLNCRRNRLLPGTSAEEHILAYRTWRILFTVFMQEKKILIHKIFSGYTQEEMNSSEDRYKDKDLHRQFHLLAGQALVRNHRENTGE